MTINEAMKKMKSYGAKGSCIRQFKKSIFEFEEDENICIYFKDDIGHIFVLGVYYVSSFYVRRKNEKK